MSGGERPVWMSFSVGVTTAPATDGPVGLTGVTWHSSTESANHFLALGPPECKRPGSTLSAWTQAGSSPQGRDAVSPSGSPAALLLLILLLSPLLGSLASCTYGDSELGVFGRDQPTPSAIPDQSLPPLQPTNPNLPVLGDYVWTSGDGLGVTVRIAVHAVRRIPGATVLDFSVTPVAAPGLRTGDPVPSSLNLGLSRQGEGNGNVFLLDGRTVAVYRPLIARAENRLQACLCTPIWIVQRILRLEGRLTSLTPQGIDIADRPPIADSPPNLRSYSSANASGAALWTGSEPRLHAEQVTTRLQGIGARECLCSTFQLWASSLTSAGHSVSLVTNFPALPPHTLGGCDAAGC